jgi:hypothetical protein
MKCNEIESLESTTKYFIQFNAVMKENDMKCIDAVISFFESHNIKRLTTKSNNLLNFIEPTFIIKVNGKYILKADYIVSELKETLDTLICNINYKVFIYNKNDEKKDLSIISREIAHLKNSN